jgi:sRNA-binding carbon storage regulator CsrA
VEGGVVTVDIIAPRHVRVDRKEFRDAQRASSISPKAPEKQP